MGRNLFILAGTLGFFGLVSFIIAFTNIAQQPGSPGDAALWRLMALVLWVLALVVALAAVITSLLEQAERRDELARQTKRRR